MARRCELTGTEPQFGHNVAHSNTKTNRRFDPNLQKATLYSDALRRKVSLKITVRAMRTVQRKGGLDAYLLATDDAKLAAPGLRLKNRVRKALSGRAHRANASS